MDSKFEDYKVIRMNELFDKIDKQIYSLDSHLIQHYDDWFKKTLDFYDSDHEPEEVLIVKLEFIYECIKWEGAQGGS